MSRREILLIVATAALAVAASLVPVLAHEGHDKVQSVPFDLDAPRKVSPETAAVIGLQTAEVDFGSVEAVLPLTGIVRALPEHVQAVASKLAGTVTSVSVRVGDRVRRGEVVAEVESPEYLRLLTELTRAQARVDELQIAVVVESEQAELAEAELARVQADPEVIAANVLSEKRAAAAAARGAARRRAIELPSAQAEHDALRRQVETIRRSVGLDLEPMDDQATHEIVQLSLRAGMDGVVIERDVVAGQGVAPGQTLMKIADYSSVQIEGEVPESLLDRLVAASGNEVRVRRDSPAQVVATGHVRFISPVVDPIKRTTHIVIEADNGDHRLRDGMFVDLSVVLREEKEAVVVPASAVLSDGPAHFVFVQQLEKDVFKKQDITPGVADDQVVEVLQGLAPGDVVVTQGAYSLSQLRPRAGTAEGGSR